MQEALQRIQTEVLTHLGIGTSGVVYALDESSVVKIFPRFDNDFCIEERDQYFRIEEKIYRRLGSHPRICRFLYTVERGLVLERLSHDLCTHLMRNKETAQQLLEWSIQVAQGLAYIHSHNILQSDIGCHNILLDDQKGLKFCDFAGSAIDGNDSMVCADTRYCPYSANEEPTTISTELFGLGSTLYEIYTARKPYQDRTDDEVRDLYHAQEFPDLNGLLVDDIISRCRRGHYSNAAEVTGDLLRLQLKHSNSVGVEKNLGSGPSFVWQAVAVLSALIVVSSYLKYTVRR